jgi:pimeloyl-ACP methyl ester carboxylesterase
VFADVNGIPVHYAQHGAGTPVLALHGSGVDHREIMAALEPRFADRPGYRRLYPDLPGMGRTPAPETIDSNDAVVELLLSLVDAVIGQEAFLLAGHSYGAYLARAIANRRPRQVAGLALVCTTDGQAGQDELPTAPEQAPAYENPTLILAGRQDASVGYAGSWGLLEHYPRATFAVLDRAGHALAHEQAGLVTALLGEWLDRVAEHRRRALYG